MAETFLLAASASLEGGRLGDLIYGSALNPAKVGLVVW